MINLTVLQLVADLCRVQAGDTHKWGSTVDEVKRTQLVCHSFYAKCLKDSAIDSCMIKRLDEMNAEDAAAKKQAEGK